MPPIDDRHVLDRLRDPGFTGRLLVTDATVLSMDPDVGDHLRADVLIAGDRIEAVEPGLASRMPEGSALVLDARGTVAIPGLVDAHRHAWQTQLRRLLVDGDLDDYMALTHWGVAPYYRPEDMYLGTRLAAVTAIDQGVTTVQDISHNGRTDDHVDETLRAWREAGVRTVFVPTPPASGPHQGNWRPRMRALRDRIPDGGLVTLRAGLHTFRFDDPALDELTASTDTLSFARELGLAIACDAVTGPVATAMIEKFAAAGELGPDITFIHCQALDEGAWRAIADAGCPVTLAATSDAQLAIGAGVPPIQEALDHGIDPALSVDVECSLTSDLFTQMRVVLNVQRMLSAQRRSRGEAGAHAPIRTRDVLRYATTAGAQAVGLDRTVGSLTPGKQADLVLVRADDVNTLPLNNAAGTVVLGAEARNVDTVLVAGRPRKWRRELLDVDVPALHRELVASRDHLLGGLGRPLDVLDRAERP